MSFRTRNIRYDPCRPSLVKNASEPLKVLYTAKGREMPELTDVGNKFKDLLFEFECVHSVSFSKDEKTQIAIDWDGSKQLPKNKCGENLIRKIVCVLDLLRPEVFLSETIATISDTVVEEILDEEEEEQDPENSEETGAKILNFCDRFQERTGFMPPYR